MQVDIRDKVIVITGAARGLGRALALGLADEGARVAVLARSEEKAQSTVEEITAQVPDAPEPFPVAADVSDEEQVQAAAAAVDEHWGRVDALINNAGRLPNATMGVLDLDVKDLHRMMDSNLVHPQRGLCVMSYSCFHETSNLCTFAFGKRAREPRSGAALQRRLRFAPVPDPSGKLPRAFSSEDRPESWMRFADGPQRHPRLRRKGTRRPHAPALRVRSACVPLSARRVPRRSGRCSTALRGNSGTKAACGLWRWPPMSPSRRDSPRGWSPGRPSGRRFRGCSESGGCGPSGGSLPQIPCTKEKKKARPADGSGRDQPQHLGHRL